MKRFREILNERWAAYTFAACSAVVLYLLLGHIGNVGGVFVKIYVLISPILGGVVIAYLMDPLVNLIDRLIETWIMNDAKRHAASVGLAAICILAMFILLIIALIPSLIDSVMTFLNNINTYVRTANRFMNFLSNVASSNNIDISGITEYGQEVLDSVLNFLPNSINTIMTTSHSMGSAFVNLIISFILAIYFLNGKEKIMNEVQRLRHAMYDDETYESRTKFFRRCNEILLKFVIYDLLDALIVGVTNAVFMMLTGMSYVSLISVIVGVLNLLPTFGPVIGWLIGGLIILLNNPMHALWFTIFTIVLQTIDGYVVKPRLFGDSMGVSGVAILIMIIVGGNLFGAVGILLAIPFTAIFAFMYDEVILPWIRNRRIELEEKEHQEEISDAVRQGTAQMDAASREADTVRTVAGQMSAEQTDAGMGEADTDRKMAGQMPTEQADAEKGMDGREADQMLVGGTDHKDSERP
ncbi:MAG: AI-2E family transporter [Lachnospiraceae bacterium]|nr:AI-2E family transporter [Lachnospiraceae bacterium]